MGQSLIYEYTFRGISLNSDLLFVWKVVSYHPYGALIINVAYGNYLISGLP